MNIKRSLHFRPRLVATVVLVYHVIGVISDLLALAGRRHRIHPLALVLMA